MGSATVGFGAVGAGAEAAVGAGAGAAVVGAAGGGAVGAAAVGADGGAAVGAARAGAVVEAGALVAAGADGTTWPAVKCQVNPPWPPDWSCTRTCAAWSPAARGTCALTVHWRGPCLSVAAFTLVPSTARAADAKSAPRPIKTAATRTVPTSTWAPFAGSTDDWTIGGSPEGDGDAATDGDGLGRSSGEGEGSGENSAFGSSVGGSDVSGVASVPPG